MCAEECAYDAGDEAVGKIIRRRSTLRDSETTNEIKEEPRWVQGGWVSRHRVVAHPTTTTSLKVRASLNDLRTHATHPCYSPTLLNTLQADTDGDGFINQLEFATMMRRR